MRIIGGTAKGFPLKRSKSGGVRPTTEKIREALFNILRSVEGKVFVDLFAGTGSVGLEALSRGAGKSLFIEKNAALARSIKEDVSLLGFEQRAEVIPFEMKKGVLFLADRMPQCDFIFIDPPYENGLVEETLNRIREAGLAHAETLIIVQHSKREPVNWDENNFSMEDRRTYGDSLLTFVKIKKEAGN